MENTLKKENSEMGVKLEQSRKLNNWAIESRIFSELNTCHKLRNRLQLIYCLQNFDMFGKVLRKEKMLPKKGDIQKLEETFRITYHPYVGFIEDEKKHTMEDVFIKKLENILKNEIVEELVTFSSVIKSLEVLDAGKSGQKEPLLINQVQKNIICRIMYKLSS